MSTIYEKQAQVLKSVFTAALEEMQPAHRIREFVAMGSDGSNPLLKIGGQSFPLNKKRANVWVLGAGKAAAEMAGALEQILGSYLRDGLIIVPYNTEQRTKRIQQFEAAHPISNPDSVAAGYEMTKFAQSIPADDIVLFVLSGGTSALMELPAGKLDIDDIQQTQQLLLKSGASIHEMNTVRKHISDIKGGQLLHHFGNITLLDLVISDVPDDRLDSIGSGPTVTDPTTFTDTFHILKEYKLWEQIPHDVRAHIAKGMHGNYPETLKPGLDSLKEKHRTFLVSSASQLAQKAGNLLRDEGFNTHIAEKAYDDDVRKVARKISGEAVSVLSRNEPVKKPAAMVFFGESTVNVTGDGLGGRNQELALAAALSIEGQHHITMLSAGTDGKDGPTDAAGAVCNASTILDARKANMEPEKFLQNNDAYHFFEQAGGLLKIGATGNNLMDLELVLIE